jgi:peptidoglycan-associated lipoprotein
MRFKTILTAFAALALLAACESSPETKATVAGSGQSTAAPPAAAPAPPPPMPAGPRPGSPEDLAKQYGDRVFFDFDKSDIRSDAATTLDGWAAWLAKYPQVTITIEGNCDERGTREYNLALGERRANAVKNYLLARGVNPNRLSTISYGKDKPWVMGSDEEAYAKNRNGHARVN